MLPQKEVNFGLDEFLAADLLAVAADEAGHEAQRLLGLGGSGRELGVLRALVFLQVFRNLQ